MFHVKQSEIFNELQSIIDDATDEDNLIENVYDYISLRYSQKKERKAWNNLLDALDEWRVSSNGQIFVQDRNKLAGIILDVSVIDTADDKPGRLVVNFMSHRYVDDVPYGD